MNSLSFLDGLVRALAVLGLVLINGFFVTAEFALVKIRETQLDAMLPKAHRRAEVARHIITHLNAYLSATQLGITIASLGLGWIAEPVFTSLLSPILGYIQSEHWRHTFAFVIGFSAITFLHIVAGELAPKWLAIQRPLPVALLVAQPLQWFYIISYPVNLTLNRSAQWLLERFGIDLKPETSGIQSEEELRLLVNASQKRSGATPLGRDIVLNALDLRRRTVREVMRPRTEIVLLNTEASLGECLDVAEKSRYSRFPICATGDVDKTLGVIHFKDLFAMRLKVKQAAELLPVARKLIYVPETARLEKLLQLFLDRKLHFAIVVDEYGSTTGMVTLENILEELVGQIQDEFDQEKPLVSLIGPQIWEVAGALPLHELEELIGQSLQEEGVTTTSGLVTHRLGGFPKVGDVLTVGPFALRVEEMDGIRVARLRLEKRHEM